MLACALASVVIRKYIMAMCVNPTYSDFIVGHLRLGPAVYLCAIVNQAHSRPVSAISLHTGAAPEPTLGWINKGVCDQA